MPTPTPAGGGAVAALAGLLLGALLPCMARGTAALPASCNTAVDLGQETSPLQGDTSTGVATVRPLCGFTDNGKELLYYVDVPAGEVITIFTETDGYDSRRGARLGDTCPGDAGQAISCVDDPDDHVVSWANEGGEPVRFWWIQDAFASGAGQFTLAWNVGPREQAGGCFSPINLAEVASPYNGDTTGKANTASTCGGDSTSDEVFFVDLAPGQKVSITYESQFTSSHEWRVAPIGSDCPGDEQIRCSTALRDTVEWENDRATPMRFFFIVSGRRIGFTSTRGAFTLSVQIEGCVDFICKGSPNAANLKFKGFSGPCNNDPCEVSECCEEVCDSPTLCGPDPLYVARQGDTPCELGVDCDSKDQCCIPVGTCSPADCEDASDQYKNNRQYKGAVRCAAEVCTVEDCCNTVCDPTICAENAPIAKIPCKLGPGGNCDQPDHCCKEDPAVAQALADLAAEKAQALADAAAEKEKAVAEALASCPEAPEGSMPNSVAQAVRDQQQAADLSGAVKRFGTAHENILKTVSLPQVGLLVALGFAVAGGVTTFRYLGNRQRSERHLRVADEGHLIMEVEPDGRQSGSE